MGVNYAASIDIPANYQCGVQSKGFKACLCIAMHRQKVLLRNRFPQICIAVFLLSIFVSVCGFSLCCGGWSIFQWSVISVPGLFIPAVCIKDLRWAAPGAAILPGASAHRGHTCGHTLSIMQSRPISPAQLTQLGQPTAHHNSPNYPAAPCLVQLPQWAMVIYNGDYVTGSSISTEREREMHTVTHKFRTTGRLAFLRVCPAGDLPTVSLGLCLSWAGSPSKLAACCHIPILISHC